MKKPVGNQPLNAPDNALLLMLALAKLALASISMLATFR